MKTTTTIYAVAFQSVNPEEASVAGHEWSVEESEIEKFFEEEKKSPHEADFEYLFFKIEFEGDPLADKDETTEWLYDYVWGDNAPDRREVIAGSRV